METKKVELLTLRSGSDDGKFSRVARELGNENINILGFTGYEENGHEVTALLVEDHEQAATVLDGKNLSVKSEPAVVVETPHKPGAAGKVTSPLQEKKVKLQKAFPYVEEAGKKTGLVLQTSDPETTQQVLQEHTEQPSVQK